VSKAAKPLGAEMEMAASLGQPRARDSGRRAQRVVRGTGMATVAKSFEHAGEPFFAGLTRLAATHPLVAQRPDLFTASDPEDATPAVERLRARTGAVRRPGPGRPRRTVHLNGEPWRL
jgi:hypothetical protein